MHALCFTIMLKIWLFYSGFYYLRQGGYVFAEVCLFVCALAR